jgi:hypothetical protein
MRPSRPVRHFWPLRNQRFFCSRLRSALLVERLEEALDADRTGHCRRHDPRGLLSSIRQSAAGGRLSRSCNESSRQRRRGAIQRDLPSRARPSARHHDPGSLALAQAPAKECNHPLVCTTNRRAERAYPTDHDRCGCAQIGDRAFCEKAPGPGGTVAIVEAFAAVMMVVVPGLVVGGPHRLSRLAM